MTATKDRTAELAAKRHDYVMENKLTHAEYYGWLVEQLGSDAVKRTVSSVLQRARLTGPAGDVLRAKLATDKNLNNIQLIHWDVQDGIVRHLAAQAGFRFWSLSDTVCTLKEAARQMAK